MNYKIVFVRTSKGDSEIGSRSNHLSGDIKRTLMLVDGKSTVDELLKRAAPSFRSEVGAMLEQLEDGGFIQDKAKAQAEEKKNMASPRMAVPKMAVPPRKKAVEQEGEDLDFTTMMRAPSPEDLAAEGEKLKKRAEEEAQAKQEADAKARAEAEARAKKEAEEKARAEAEAKAKRDAEAARLRAEQEAKAKQEAEAKALEAAKEKARREIEDARLKAKQEAARAKAEAEVARRRAEEEAARVKAEIEAAKAKAEAEAKALAEAQEKARKEIEAARKKAEEEAARARAEAEAARKKAEEEAAKARAEAEAAKIRAEEEARALAEAQEKARKEIEAAREKAEQEAAKAKAEAEAARLEAEQEVARVRAEKEAARLKAEEEEARARAEAAAEKERAAAEAKAQAEAEAKAKLEAAEQERAEAEAKARAEAEEARAKAEQEATKAEQEAAKAEAEAKIKQEAEKLHSQEAQLEVEHSAAKGRAGVVTGKFRATPESARSMIATVLFFDVVGYTKKSVSKQIELKRQFNELVSQFIEGVDEAQRIILDTGDGAAIGFLQHPEDALEVAMQFRDAVTANNHRDYPELNVRIGIHLGPVNVVKDMNSQFNMVGDGINDAQRIMSFAGTDQIFISRSYYDVVSRLNAEYAGLFKYRGVQKDKHGREHQVYQIVVAGTAAGKPSAANGKETTAESDFSLGPIVLNGLAEFTSPAAEEPSPAREASGKSPEETAAEKEAAAQRKAQQEEEVRKRAEEEAKRRAKEEEEARKQAEEEARRRAKEEEEAYKLAAEQAKAWEEAEKRAKAEAETQSRLEQAEASSAAKSAKKSAKPGKARRKPLPWGKIGTGLIMLLLVAVAVAPYVWPMQGYLPQIEKRMSALLKQPVHVGGLSAALFPTPKLELSNVTVGTGQEMEAGNVVLHFGFGSLFSDTKSINDAELNNLRLSESAFDKTLSWLALAGSDPVYPLTHATLNNAQVNSEMLKLPAINGSVAFAQGHFSNAALEDKEGKLKLNLSSQQGQLALSVSLKDAALPILPKLHFSTLDAEGKVRNGEVDLENVDATLYGGTLGGSMHLNWQKGWVMQGRITVKDVDIHQALPKAGIEGELAANAGYTIRAASLPMLGGNPGLDGDFSLQKGVINDMDMVETVRLAGAGAPAQGGRTHFDELQGRLTLDNGIQHYRQLHLSAGVLGASGYLDVDSAGNLDGRLAAELNVRPGTVPLSLSGKVGQPVLRVGR